MIEIIFLQKITFLIAIFFRRRHDLSKFQKTARWRIGQIPSSCRTRQLGPTCVFVQPPARPHRDPRSKKASRGISIDLLVRSGTPRSHRSTRPPLSGVLLNYRVSGGEVAEIFKFKIARCLGLSCRLTICLKLWINLPWVVI